MPYWPYHALPARARPHRRPEAPVYLHHWPRRHRVRGPVSERVPGRRRAKRRSLAPKRSVAGAAGWSGGAVGRDRHSTFALRSQAERAAVAPLRQRLRAQRRRSAVLARARRAGASACAGVRREADGARHARRRLRSPHGQPLLTRSGLQIVRSRRCAVFSRAIGQFGAEGEACGGAGSPLRNALPANGRRRRVRARPGHLRLPGGRCARLSAAEGDAGLVASV